MNNQESKHSLLMKFGQFMSYYKRKNIEKFHKNCDQTLLCLKKIQQNLFWKIKTFEASYLYQLCIKTIKMCPNQQTHRLRFLFIESSLKIKKGLELVSWPYFSQNFLIQNFLLCYINWPNFILSLCLLPKLFSKMFHVLAFDDIMTFEYLKSQI